MEEVKFTPERLRNHVSFTTMPCHPANSFMKGAGFSSIWDPKANKWLIPEKYKPYVENFVERFQTFDLFDSNRKAVVKGEETHYYITPTEYRLLLTLSHKISEEDHLVIAYEDDPVEGKRYEGWISKYPHIKEMENRYIRHRSSILHHPDPKNGDIIHHYQDDSNDGAYKIDGLDMVPLFLEEDDEYDL